MLRRTPTRFLKACDLFPTHRLARRHAELSPRALAANIGMQLSAVSHSEAGKQPPAVHLRDVALTIDVDLMERDRARGNGFDKQVRMSSIPAAHGLLVENQQEIRLLDAIRTMSSTARVHHDGNCEATGSTMCETNVIN